MRYFKAQGFIIKRRNFNEADRFVTIFTKNHGKIRALAKGVRKISSRRASHLEIFNKVNTYLYRGKTINYMSEVETIQTFPYLRKNLSRVAVAYQMCELVEKICPEEQKQENICDLLSKGLIYLNQMNGITTEHHLNKVSQRFTARLLCLSGFLARDNELDPEEYAQRILERRLSALKFLSETYKL